VRGLEKREALETLDVGCCVCKALKRRRKRIFLWMAVDYELDPL
jgi:hypothetical protein